jgi:hypothetical protein
VFTGRMMSWLRSILGPAPAVSRLDPLTWPAGVVVDPDGGIRFRGVRLDGGCAPVVTVDVAAALQMLADYRSAAGGRLLLDATGPLAAELQRWAGQLPGSGILHRPGGRAHPAGVVDLRDADPGGVLAAAVEAGAVIVPADPAQATTAALTRSLRPHQVLYADVTALVTGPAGHDPAPLPVPAAARLGLYAEIDPHDDVADVAEDAVTVAAGSGEPVACLLLRGGVGDVAAVARARRAVRYACIAHGIREPRLVLEPTAAVLDRTALTVAAVGPVHCADGVAYAEVGTDAAQLPAVAAAVLLGRVPAGPLQPTRLMAAASPGAGSTTLLLPPLVTGDRLVLPGACARPVALHAIGGTGVRRLDLPGAPHDLAAPHHRGLT